MHLADYVIIAVYLVAVLLVGFWYYRRQQGVDAYLVGDRQMGAGHLGLSVVATDVGGGFSIGLGGLGFAMGLSGSWMLFTGLVGAWLAAVLVIPRVKPLGDRYGWLSYPDFLEHRFDGRTRLLAAVLSALGYAAFVGAQILAGAKLSAGAFEVDLWTAVAIMAVVVVVYTAFGGLQAVVFTDTIQWIVLLVGLLGLALPFAWHEVGGWDGLVAKLPAERLSLTNVSVGELVTWFVTILPIWFVGMTLYQRIYAARDVKTAKRAWYLAGLLEYPLMAFAGASLGLIASAMFPDVGKEMGLPILIRTVLPIGVTGLVLAAYFSAIMSTADSCLLASVGNLVNDIYARHVRPRADEGELLRVSRALTLVIGFASVGIAYFVPSVLDAVLLAYSFMVAGLFIPTLAGLLWPRATSRGAFWAALAGGSTSLLVRLVPDWVPLGEPLLVALPVSLLVLVSLSFAPERAES